MRDRCLDGNVDRRKFESSKAFDWESVVEEITLARCGVAKRGRRVNLRLYRLLQHPIGRDFVARKLLAIDNNLITYVRQ
jgi:hypothetical protein